MAKTRRTSIEVLLVIFVGQQWHEAPFFMMLIKVYHQTHYAEVQNI